MVQADRVRSARVSCSFFVARWNDSLDPRIALVAIQKGADFEIDLSGFRDPAPSFAYVDDVEGGVLVLHGLEAAGQIEIANRPDFMWLRGTRKCSLMRATADGLRAGRASFRGLGVGEFCVEIYFVSSSGEIELIHENDFCFK